MNPQSRPPISRDKWQGQQAASGDASRTSWHPYFWILAEKPQDNHWLIYINWSVEMPHPWYQTLEEARTDTSSLIMTDEKNMEHTWYAFAPPHNPGYYPPTMRSTQEQALETERFRQNQALFRRYTAVDKALKNQIVTAVQTDFLSSLVDQLIGFGQF